MIKKQEMSSSQRDDEKPFIRGMDKEAFFQFSGMNKEQTGQFHKGPLPKWKYIDKGLNLRGKCLNQPCAAYNQFVYSIKKFGKFNISREVMTSKCVSCGTYLKQVDNAYFYLCQWKGEGMKQGTDEVVKIQGEATSADDFKYFEEGQPENWSFLEMEVIEIK